MKQKINLSIDDPAGHQFYTIISRHNFGFLIRNFIREEFDFQYKCLINNKTMIVPDNNTLPISPATIAHSSVFNGEGVGIQPELDFTVEDRVPQPYTIEDFAPTSIHELHYCQTFEDGQSLFNTLLSQNRKAMLVFSPAESNSWYISGNRWVVVIEVSEQFRDKN